jgi:AbrB family looped-hinge helix DNA binding protein
MIVTVSEKGQLVIPAKIRKLLGITTGTRLEVQPEAGGFRVSLDEARRTKTAAECLGISGYAGKRVSLKEMDAARHARRT